MKFETSALAIMEQRRGIAIIQNHLGAVGDTGIRHLVTGEASKARVGPDVRGRLCFIGFHSIAGQYTIVALVSIPAEWMLTWRGWMEEG